MTFSRAGLSILITIFILNAIGTIMIYSASAVYADKFYDDSLFFLKRHGFYLLLGFVALFLGASLNLSWLRRNARWMVCLSIIILCLVFLPFLGKSGGGAKRWINLIVFNFQPVEFTKIAVTLYLSDYLSRNLKQIQSGSIKIFIPPAIILGIVFCLMILQPDLGSCVFLFLLTGILFFLSGIRIP